MSDQVQGGGAAAAASAETDRRKGGDRRQGDRRGDGDRRTRDSFGGIGHKSGSFFDHPWWVVGTIVFGVLVGMLIMIVTSTPTGGPVTRTNVGSGGIDVIVKPGEGAN